MTEKEHDSLEELETKEISEEESDETEEKK